MTTRALVALSCVAVLAAGTAGCGAAGAATSGSGIRGLLVTGPVGQRPRVHLRAPLHVGKTLVQVVHNGHGPQVRLDRVFVIQLTIVDGRTGATAVSTYDAGRTPMAITDSESTLFPVLTRAVVGRPQGSRVVVAATAQDAYGDTGAPQYHIRPGDPLVMVADVIAVPPTSVLDGPEGTPEKPPARVPRVAELDGQPTGILFGVGGKTLPAPRNLVVVPLVQGNGPVVGEHDLVTLDYLGQVWGRSAQFADTYPAHPVTVALGANRVIPAWERALVGQRLGSRLLVLAPPAWAFGETGNPPGIPGNAALAYVIDILGVS